MSALSSNKELSSDESYFIDMELTSNSSCSPYEEA